MNLPVIPAFFLLLSIHISLISHPYFSTDLAVHRNWLSVTFNTPPSKWYHESTDGYNTLDYPPSFAFLELFLSKLRRVFYNHVSYIPDTHKKMIDTDDHKNQADAQTVDTDQCMKLMTASESSKYLSSFHDSSSLLYFSGRKKNFKISRCLTYCVQIQIYYQPNPFAQSSLLRRVRMELFCI